MRPTSASPRSLSSKIFAIAAFVQQPQIEAKTVIEIIPEGRWRRQNANASLARGTGVESTAPLWSRPDPHLPAKVTQNAASYEISGTAAQVIFSSVPSFDEFSGVYGSRCATLPGAQQNKAAQH